MVRGGEASRIVQEQAIRFASQNNKKLVFLHIIDLSSLGLGNEILLDAARTEVTWLARVNLNLAYRRARRSEIPSETVILYGPIFRSVVDFLQDRKPDCLFLGTPREGMKDYEERIARVRQFAEHITDATSVSVCIGSGDEIKTLPEDRPEGDAAGGFALPG
jgi:hypothetical protein